MAAWLVIIDRERESLVVGVKRFLRGLWLSILPTRAYPQFHVHYSRVAADRLQRLAESGVIPMERLSWRAYHAAGSALQALCSRDVLQEKAVLEMYAPFEPYIP